MTRNINTVVRRTSFLPVAVLIAFLVPAGTMHAQGRQNCNSLVADLSPLNQIPTVPAKSRGSFEAEIKQDGTLSFTLSYSDVRSSVIQAHIHFSAGTTNGGAIVFLCGGPKPACTASDTITGTLTAADIRVLPASNPDSVITHGIQRHSGCYRRDRGHRGDWSAGSPGSDWADGANGSHRSTGHPGCDGCHGS